MCPSTSRRVGADVNTVRGRADIQRLVVAVIADRHIEAVGVDAETGPGPLPSLPMDFERGRWPEDTVSALRVAPSMVSRRPPLRYLSKRTPPKISVSRRRSRRFPAEACKPSAFTVVLSPGPLTRETKPSRGAG